MHNAAAAAAAAVGDALHSPCAAQPHAIRALCRATHVFLAARTQASLRRRARPTGSRSTGASRSTLWRAQSPIRSRPRRRRAKCLSRGGAWVRMPLEPWHMVPFQRCYGTKRSVLLDSHMPMLSQVITRMQPSLCVAASISSAVRKPRRLVASYTCCMKSEHVQAWTKRLNGIMHTSSRR